ncbi:MAG: SpoIIE family protein phosphatase [Candidatus Krumholzibacteria bacterium]|nr:SpoIIE family protein phosphatase [Candidatus Krumholzibacteria bacterium]
MTEPTQPTVLVLDDEDIVTTTIRSFLELETEYSVLAFTSPREALEAMARTHVDVVISDFLMPEMSGLEFLAEVKRRYPDVVRLLLTGYADKENAIRAINEVEVFQYVEKPWDNNHLLLVIRNGLRQRRLDAQLADKVRELDRTLRERDRIAQAHDVLAGEIALARRVQQAMIPRELPRAGDVRFSACYIPVLAVGGDYYDVVPLAADRFAAIVADATGHGVQAALSTTLMKSTFRDVAAGLSRAGGVPSPADILRRMNQTIYGVLPTELFVAATAAVVDASGGRLHVCGGGAPHALHVRRATGTVERIASNGLLLGVVDAGVFEPGEDVAITLAPGDTVVLHTDGLSEIDDDAGVAFGDGAILDAAAAGAREGRLADGLVAAARAFAPAAHQWDDITLLAVERASD